MTDDDLPAVRASDREREQTVARLRDAVVEGRLTLEEFGDRVELAHRTATRAELERLVSDVPAPSSPAAAPAGASQRAVFSEVARRGSWRVPPRSSWRCVFGTIHLDLREAVVDGPLVELDVHNVFGTVTVIVPEGVAVDVEGGGAFASQRIEPSAAPGVADAPRLLIRTSGPGGTLEVRRSARGDRVRAVLGRVGLGG